MPLPKILAWSNDDMNLIGAEYIFMERATGVQLLECWDTMPSHDHIQLISNVSKMIKQMAALFPAYCSMYFTDVPIDHMLTERMAGAFCIGPHCGTSHWNSAPHESLLCDKVNAAPGPWYDLRQYCNGLFSSASLRSSRENTGSLYGVASQEKVEDHRLLLHDTAAICTALATTSIIQSVAHPTLLHPDLHKRNIFVSQTDPTNVTAIIDWQATSIEPAFVYAIDTPDFATPPTQDINHEAQEKTDEERITKGMFLYSNAFEVCMRGFVPRFGAARSVDDILLRHSLHLNTSWRGSVASGRRDNIELSRRWLELGLPGSCSYLPSQQEVSAHQKRYEDFEDVQALELGLIQRLPTDTDGWVPSHDWERVKSVHDSMYRAWMRIAASDMTEARAWYLWPFDPPDHEDDGQT